MNKPNNYDAVQSSTFTPVELGGHVAVIKQVSETKSKNGQDMIVVLFDFDRTDIQAGHFTNDFNADTREDKKWPFLGSCWIMVNDYKDKNSTSRNFKRFCESVEKSNGYRIQWGIDNWGKQFVGKTIGVVYGEEEDEYNGERKMRTRLKWFCGANEAKTAKVPPAKLMKTESTPQQPTFTPVNDEEIPF